MLAIALIVLLQVKPEPVAVSSPPPRLVIAGGGSLPEKVYSEFRRLAGDRPRLVIIPTASSREVNLPELKRTWKSRGFDSVEVLHTKDRSMADREQFAKPLTTATAVWFGGGQQQRIADAYVGTRTEKEIYNLMKRGGVVGGTSAGAAIQTRIMIRSGRDKPDISKGLNLLPGAIVDQHFLRRNRLSRLLHAVRANPNCVGFGIDENTALVVENNKAKVVGDSYVLQVRQTDGKISLKSFDSRDDPFTLK